MITSRCFLLVTLFVSIAISLTGCTSSTQSTHLKNNTPSVGLSHNATIGSDEHNENFFRMNTYNTADPTFSQTSIAKRISSRTSDFNPAAGLSSEEIDHALELCESAQHLWEKGELDKALLKLDAAYASILELNGNVDPELNQQKEDLRFMISKRILEIYASRHIIVKGQHKAIPIIINRYVQKEIDRLTGPEKKFFIQSVQRSGQYRPYIVAELKKAGLPEELSWLPLIESGFKVKALSPARALGLWQFIPSTGYKFGLKRNYYIDERLDPIKSTHAAISYMSELHKIFGDWSTVLAAYNCGEGRVLRTIRSQKINYLDNFWDLYKKLPRETARYVPRFLATLHIMNNLEQYKIEIPKIESPLDFETVKVKKQIRLNDIARNLSIPSPLLKALNPELKYSLLPPESYPLRIPTGKKKMFLASIDKLKQSHASSKTHAYYSKNGTLHRIKRGETLSIIAKKYGTSAVALARANRISIRSILSIGKKLRIPGSASKKSIARIAEGKKNSTPAKPLKHTLKQGDNLWVSSTAKYVKHIVKQGDNLWHIARKYNSTTKAIKSENKLSGSALKIGQKLIIPTSLETSPSYGTSAVELARKNQTSTKSTLNTKNKKSNTLQYLKHTVKKGDNLWLIARKYNSTTKAIKSKNRLSGSSLNIDQVLIIPTRLKTSSSPVKSAKKSVKPTYRVKSGDNPAIIAQKYNITLQRLLALNHLTQRSKIYPGQRLVVE